MAGPGPINAAAKAPAAAPPPSRETDPAFAKATAAAQGAPPAGEAPQKSGFSWSDFGHAALDVVGMVPGVGEVADLANAGWYAAEGDYGNAALSAASAIPFAGNLATGAKWAKRGIEAADAIGDVAKTADHVGDATKLANKADDGVKAADGALPAVKADTAAPVGAAKQEPALVGATGPGARADARGTGGGGGGGGPTGGGGGPTGPTGGGPRGPGGNGPGGGGPRGPDGPDGPGGPGQKGAGEPDGPEGGKGPDGSKGPEGSKGAEGAGDKKPGRFSSKDPLVGDLANKLDGAVPGGVKDVNVPIKGSDGKLVTDADIQLNDGTIIQVKSGGGKGMADQVQRTKDATGERVIAYGPDLKGSVVKNLEAQGHEVYRNAEDLIRALGG